MSAIGHAVWVERKRLAFIVFLTFTAGVLFYARHDLTLFGVPLALVSGLLYAGLIGPVVLMILILAPRFRFLLEGIAVARVTVAALAYFSPAIGDVILAAPLLNALLVVSLGSIISRCLHGRVRRQTLPRLSERVRLYAQGIRPPARLDARPWQMRYVGFMDDAAPVRA